MKIRYYRFAGVELAVEMEESWISDNERNLAPFAAETVSDPHHFCFKVVDALSPPEGECIVTLPDYVVYTAGDKEIRYVGLSRRSWDGAYICVQHSGNEHQVQLNADQFMGMIGTKTILNAIGAEHLVARAGGFILHASYINWKGQAILFTAPSGTGKSTQADLWIKLRGAELINGDRAAVRVIDGEIIAEGLPFSGSSQVCKNCSLPVAAVVYLKQAPKTAIRRLQGFEAFRRIWEGCSVNTWDMTDMDLVSNAVQNVIESIPVYELACTPDESAVIALEHSIVKEIQP